MNIKTGLFVIFISWIHTGFGQDWGHPLPISLQLAANFGEVRTNHYHMGLDIRTQQRENIPVLAAQDGYVCRVYISPYGYGNMLMLRHPNGYTTLYAHLNTFMSPLAAYVREQQYRQKSWMVDLTIPEGLFQVKKGQQIALSGNTGGSQGPHLHFEIRDSNMDKHTDPLTLQSFVPDKISPSIYRMYWYDRRLSIYESEPHLIALKKQNGVYTSAANIIKVSSPVLGLGFTGEDMTSNSPFKFGIYSAIVTVDSVPVFSYELNHFNNEQSRYVNAGIDYKEKMTAGKTIQFLFALPGNKLPIFKGSNGVITLNDHSVHSIQIDYSDASGNHSNVFFKVQLSDTESNNDGTHASMLSPNAGGTLNTQNAYFTYSDSAFYDYVPFEMQEMTSADGHQFSPTIALGKYYIPIHDFYTVGIKADKELTPDIKPYAYLELKSKNLRYTSKGTWSENILSGRFNRLGNVRILCDSAAPSIKTISWEEGSHFLKTKNISVRAYDSQSELKDVSMYLDDNQWLLVSQRGSTFTYTIDDYLTKGKHSLKIIATDVAGNKAEKTFTIYKD